jgi:2-oxo-3-hexenedioate decarboxylase
MTQGVVDARAIAQELVAAYTDRRILSVLPSAREAAFDLAAAYAVEAELVRLRRETGRTTVGRKVGFANKALWRALKLDTLVWAHMYDDTVRFAKENTATISLTHMCSPKIEPEVVFRMKGTVPAGAGAAEVLGAVEWLALGFEIIDCVFSDWKFQPADFVAAYGLHAALVVGEPRAIVPAAIPALVEQLPRFTVRLMNGDRLAGEGSGKNSLRSPALCVGELAAALGRQPGAAPLSAGEIVSSGTLTESQPIAAGQSWRAVVEGIELPPLTLHTA